MLFNSNLLQIITEIFLTVFFSINSIFTAYEFIFRYKILDHSYNEHACSFHVYKLIYQYTIYMSTVIVLFALSSGTDPTDRAQFFLFININLLLAGHNSFLNIYTIHSSQCVMFTNQICLCFGFKCPSLGTIEISSACIILILKKKKNKLMLAYTPMYIIRIDAQ